MSVPRAYVADATEGITARRVGIYGGIIACSSPFPRFKNGWKRQEKKSARKLKPTSVLIGPLKTFPVILWIRYLGKDLICFLLVIARLLVENYHSGGQTDPRESKLNAALPTVGRYRNARFSKGL